MILYSSQIILLNGVFMKIDFYYWNYMCPLNHEMIELLKKYQEKIEIYFHDIKRAPLNFLKNIGSVSLPW